MPRTKPERCQNFYLSLKKKKIRDVRNIRSQSTCNPFRFPRQNIWLNASWRCVVNTFFLGSCSDVVHIFVSGLLDADASALHVNVLVAEYRSKHGRLPSRRARTDLR